MNALDYAKRRLQKKLWSHKRRGKLESKNKQRDREYIARKDIVKCVIRLSLRCCGHTEGMKAIAIMEGTGKKGSPRKDRCS